MAGAMCNLFTQTVDPLQGWAARAGFAPVTHDNAVPTGERFPKRLATILRNADRPELVDMQWGFERTVPGKRSGTTRKTVVTNVRNLASPFWRAMLASPAARCLVPFTEFAEPVMGGGRATHWFKVLDRPVAAFAGIWRMTDDGERFAFLTCEPNSLIAPLHPKAMPVVLDEADYSAWLTADWQTAARLVAPFPAQLMAVR
jgi:putative SOS response-associated peptidase YedK